MGRKTGLSSSAAADLLQSATDAGTLSPAASAALQFPDLNAILQAGFGTPAVDVKASEVTLVTLLIDDSGSIRFASNADAVRQGHNAVLEALTGSKQSSGVLVSALYLNGTVLYAYSPLDRAEKMTSKNYDPNGGTPLYDRTAEILALVVAKAQEFEDAGVPVRAVTFVITDGHDEGSLRQSARSVSKVVRDLLVTERHIIGGVGISDGQTDFMAVFTEMGIDPKWILTPGNNPSEIRKAFGVVSQSALRASQSGASFSKAAGGGFAV